MINRAPREEHEPLTHYVSKVGSLEPMNPFQPEKLPWMTSAPVRASRLKSAPPAFRKYSVEVDLAAVRPFSKNESLVPAEDLLWCDLQTRLAFTVPGMLGAGRSGVYRGKYLKGIGRTQLAANWNSADRYHSSGHLLASGGLREYLVTAYLRASNLEHSIVPCEAILYGALDRSMKNFDELTFGGKLLANPMKVAIDKRCRAVTVKPFDFVRFSNLAWQLSHLGFEEMLAPLNFKSFVNLFARYVTAAGRDLSPADLAPATLAAEFARIVSRVPRHFQGFFEAGVYWGSFVNNFSFDGRFLDLELALFAGGPALALFSNSTEDRIAYPAPYPQLVMGTEVMRYAYEARLFIRFLDSQLRFFQASCANIPADQRDYLEAFLQEWGEACRDLWVMTREGTTGAAWKILAGALDLSTTAAAAARRVVEHEYDRVFLGASTLDSLLDFRAAAGAPRVHGDPAYSFRLFTLKECQVNRKNYEVAEFMAELLDRLHALRGTEELVEETERAVKKIERQFSGKRHAKVS